MATGEGIHFPGWVTISQAVQQVGGIEYLFWPAGDGRTYFAGTKPFDLHLFRNASE
jgi:hypothetical protein